MHFIETQLVCDMALMILSLFFFFQSINFWFGLSFSLLSGIAQDLHFQKQSSSHHSDHNQKIGGQLFAYHGFVFVEN